MKPKTTLAALSRKAGKGHYRRRLEVQFPRSYEAFVEVIYEEIDRAIGFMEDDAGDFVHAQEDVISRALLRSLKQAGYLASHDADSGGHCDISIISVEPRFSWLAEAKRWNGPAYVEQGLDQLLDRYSTGAAGATHGGILVYIQSGMSADRFAEWKQHLATLTRKYPELCFIADESRPGLSFRTRQVHPRTGKAAPRYEIRHMGLTLYRPASKKK